jgi:hypothetical protein
VAGVGLENTTLRVFSCLLFMVLYHDTAKELSAASSQMENGFFVLEIQILFWSETSISRGLSMVL